jgi:polyphosphate kinase 2 (PPK2 family)
VKEREHWNDYMRAYEEAINATAAPQAPWFIVPADDQWETRAVVGRLVREKLEEMDPKVPVLDAKALAELKEVKSLLESGH